MVSQKENQPRSSGARPSDANDNGKDPVRVEAGKKAAETRKRHEQEAAEGRGTEASGAAGGDAQGKNPNRVEGGKKAAETRKSNASDGGQDSARDQDSNDQGKDPVRVEAGKKAAAHRSHEDFVEMGKKGGEARREGATTEGQDDEYDGKDPVRIEAGKKAAETRKIHEQEAAEGRGDQTRQSKERNTSEDGTSRGQGTDGKDPVRVEADKKSGEARRHQRDNDQEEDVVILEDQNQEVDGKDPVRVEAGKKAAAHFDHEHFVELGKMGADARWHGKHHSNHEHYVELGKMGADARWHGKHQQGEEHDDGKDPVRVEAGKKAAAHFDHEHFVELGKMGADARWHGKHQHDDESATEDPKAKNAREAGKKDEETRKANVSTNEDGKDPVRVEAGKKAAAHRSHEDFVEMGKKSGEARQEQSDANKPEQMEEGEEYDGKDPVRVEAGKKAAAHFDHEHFVELGKMGADARWHGGKHQHDDGSATEDPKAKNARVEEAAGSASNDAE